MQTIPLAHATKEVHINKNEKRGFKEAQVNCTVIISKKSNLSAKLATVLVFNGRIILITVCLHKVLRAMEHKE